MDDSDETLLHIAVKSKDLAATQLALEKGINIHTKDNEGKTPLQILVQERLDILVIKEDTSKYDLFSFYYYNEKPTLGKKSKSLLAQNEKLVNLLLENDVTSYDSIDDIGLSSFHVASTLYDCSAVECISNAVADIDQQVNADSQLWPGYTALHFASSCCNIDTVKILVTRGADLLIRDAKGVTPFDICAKSFNSKELYSILTHVPAWKDILFSDGKTKLIDYICSLRDTEDHRLFLKNNRNMSKKLVAQNSPLWSGYTILHVAVTVLSQSNWQIIKRILVAGIHMVNIQDSYGSTAISLAFRQNKTSIIWYILRYMQEKTNEKIKYTVDKDDLSSLHIFIAAGGSTTAKQFIMDADVNMIYKGPELRLIKPGWTPLHIAASEEMISDSEYRYNNESEIVKMLLEQGADLLKTDSRGFTAIHMLLGCLKCNTAKVFFAAKEFKESVVKDIGLTHLHVAAWADDPEAIERLLKLGSNIEATIDNVEDERLKKFEGCRPIHVAMMNKAFSAFQILVRKGANVFAKKPDGLIPFFKILTAGEYDKSYLVPFVDNLWNDRVLQWRIKHLTGITMLHLACYVVDRKKIEELLTKTDVNVNAKVSNSSTVWPGFTPLHFLITVVSMLTSPKLRVRRAAEHRIIDNLIELLPNKGADVTMTNANGDTPVHMTLKIDNKEIAYKHAATLLERQTDFGVNPVNAVGMSHFHVACFMKNVIAAKRFLKYLILLDVNQAISSTDDSIFAGQTPLMMALSDCDGLLYNAASQVELVKLLLKHGANVHTVDAFGYTPLHKVAACTNTRGTLMDKILIDDTDINKRAKDGITPIEILLSDGATVKEIEYFVQQGARINSYNPVSDIGYMTIVLTSDNYKKWKASILNIMMNSPDIAKVDDRGRNAIHNAVTTSSSKHTSEDNYLELFEKLVELGCDVNQKDNRGRTALHLAFMYDNTEAISALMMCGADIDDIDANGILPPFYSHTSDQHRFGTEDLNKFLTIFFNKCQSLDLEMNSKYLGLFTALIDRCQAKGIRNVFDAVSFEVQVEESKSLKIGQRGLTAHDFLCETKFLKAYSVLLPVECENLNSLIKLIDKKRFSEVWRLLKIQCRKALDRMNLLASATSSLRALIGIPLPDLCVDVVFRSLNNSDLRNLNVAVIKNYNVEMAIE